MFHITLQIGAEVIKPSAIVRDLGVQLDSELTMKRHVAMVAALCVNHLHRLRQIRHRAGKEVTTQLVIAFITTCLDYCNSMLAGLTPRLKSKFGERALSHAGPVTWNSLSSELH